MQTPTAMAQKQNTREELLGSYYTAGQFNSPKRIGYVMKLIRELKPLTEGEWKDWYLKNIHDMDYLERLAGDMFRTTSVEDDFMYRDCLNYIQKMMFHRTFLGYNKDKPCLQFLRETISPDIQESPADWTHRFGTPYYAIGKEDKKVILRVLYEPCHIQIPEEVQANAETYCKESGATLFEIEYVRGLDGAIVFTDPEIAKKIKEALAPKPKKLPNRVKIDFGLLHDYIAERRDKDMLASFPFIIQFKTGEKSIIWFQYQITGEDENLFVQVNSVFLIDRKGFVSSRKLSLEVPVNENKKQPIDYDRYISELEKLYKNYSVNKMNSLLWNMGNKPLYDASRAVMREIIAMKQEESGGSRSEKI